MQLAYVLAEEAAEHEQSPILPAANELIWGTIAFLIGGADGLPPDVSRAAHARVSLSPLTFPHRLARLVLVEQIYLAMTILRGEPYAH